jgi:hypothetical protein
MNCTEFESVVVDIARGVLMEAATRREGLAHATGCERCGRRRALSGLLAAAVAEDAGRTASAAVEQALLSAFREREFVGRPRRRVLWLGVAAAAVAALLMVPVTVQKPHAPQIVNVPTLMPAPAVEPTKIIAPVYRETRKPVVRTLRAMRPKAPIPKPQSAREDREVVTDFIPVIYDPEPVDHGRMVRVRLPRSALAAFGLPMNEQRAEETIQADVVLGEDGLARAVRFVK